MDTGKVLFGVLAGLAVGATLGILFAPDKGSDTRKKISKKGDAYAEELEDNFNEFVDGISSKFDKAKAKAARTVENIEI